MLVTIRRGAVDVSCRQSKKCAADVRPYPPGEHGKGRIRESDYSVQMREKQKTMALMSQHYNKALFTLSYLISLQLRKYMEMFTSITKMKVEDLQDPTIMQ